MIRNEFKAVFFTEKVTDGQGKYKLIKTVTIHIDLTLLSAHFTRLEFQRKL